MRIRITDLLPKIIQCGALTPLPDGQQQVVRCHHALAEALRTYTDAAGFAEDRKDYLFHTPARHAATVLTEQPMDHSYAWCMICRPAAAVSTTTLVGYHSFRPTGITLYLGSAAVGHPQEMSGTRKPEHDQAVRPDYRTIDAR